MESKASEATQCPGTPVAQHHLRRRRLLGLRAHLAALVVAVLAPALGFGGAAAWEALRGQRAASEARLVDTAWALARAVDGDINGHISALTVVAASPGLEEGGNLAAFDRLARGAAAALDTWIVAYAPDGRRLIHTALPFGSLHPGTGDTIAPGGGGAAIARVFETGRPVVSDLALGRVTGRHTAFVFVPVTRDGVALAALGMPLLPDRLSRLLAGQAAASGRGTVTLTDARGVLVGRSRNAEQLVGRERPTRIDSGPQGESGLLLGKSIIDGAPLRTAYHRLSAAPGWMVWVNEPEASFASAAFRPIVALVAGGALALLLGLMLAALLARRVLRPVAALVHRAEVVAKDGNTRAAPPPVLPASVAEFETLRLAGERAEAALREGEAEFRATFEESPAGKAQAHPATGRFLHVNEAFCTMMGYSSDALLGGMTVTDITHPEDHAANQARIRAAVASGERFRAEKRYVRKDGAVVWAEVSVGFIPDPRTGRPMRMIATLLDVTGRKAAEERLLLLAREVDHRAKNALAVVQAAVRLAPKHDATAFAQAVEGRVAALARAQVLLADAGWEGALLRSVAENTLAPYSQVQASRSTEVAMPVVELQGPAVVLVPQAVQPISLVLHELATNAAKYGALSAASGTVHLAWSLDGTGNLSLAWSEAGGPVVPDEPRRRGFGSRMVAQLVERKLGGQLCIDWQANGLVVSLQLPARYASLLPEPPSPPDGGASSLQPQAA